MHNVIVPSLKIHFILEKIGSILSIVILTYLRPSTSLYICLTIKLDFNQVVCTKLMADGIILKWAHVAGKQRAFLFDGFASLYSFFLRTNSGSLKSYCLLPRALLQWPTTRLCLFMFPQSPNITMLGTKLQTQELLRDSLQEPSTLAVTHAAYTSLSMQVVKFYATCLASIPPLCELCILSSCIQLSTAKRGHQTPCIWPHFQKCLTQLTWKW